MYLLEEGRGMEKLVIVAISLNLLNKSLETADSSVLFTYE